MGLKAWYSSIPSVASKAMYTHVHESTVILFLLSNHALRYCSPFSLGLDRSLHDPNVGPIFQALTRNNNLPLNALRFHILVLLAVFHPSHPIPSNPFVKSNLSHPIHPPAILYQQ